MLPNRDGRFKARVLEHGVDKTGPNKLTTFVCRFQLFQELINDEWEPVDQDFNITGYFYIEKRDLTLNTNTINNLKIAFGWDGRETFWLQDSDFSQIVVQVTLGYETYKDKVRIKVQYVDGENVTPTSVPQADDATRRAINARLGPKLRANAGGTQVTTPKPNPVSQPVTPQAPPGNVLGCKEQAWTAFTEACPNDYTNAQKDVEWFRVVDQMFPGKAEKDFTVEDWARVEKEAPAMIIPF